MIISVVNILPLLGMKWCRKQREPLRQTPSGQEIVRQILGHRDVNTTTTYYSLLQRDRAFEVFDEALKVAGREEDEK